MERVWRRCGEDVKRVGEGVESVRGCGEGVKRVWRSCGEAVEKVWRGCE